MYCTVRELDLNPSPIFAFRIFNAFSDSIDNHLSEREYAQLPCASSLALLNYNKSSKKSNVIHSWFSESFSNDMF
jgi:hypothetical protein